MLIVFIGSKDINKLGGIENYTYNLCLELIKLGHTPIVYCATDNNNYINLKGIHIYNIKSTRFGFLTGAINSLRATLRCIKLHPDIIHYNFPPFNFIYSWIPKFFGIKSIFEYHSFVWDSPKYSKWRRKIFYYITKLTTHHRLCLTVSAEKANFLISHKLTKECIIIHPGITPDNYSNSNLDILRKFNLSKNKYFIFLGRLDRIKNIDILIQAFNIANIYDYKLVICGSNDEDLNYVQRLKDISTDKIIFTGPVYGVTKNSLLNYSLALCLISDSEGLPIVVIEAMYAKKICLVSNINGNREALGESGIWVKVKNIEDTKNKIENIIKNYDDFKWQEEYNFRRVNSCFLWQSIAMTYINCISSYIQGNNDPICFPPEHH